MVLRIFLKILGKKKNIRHGDYMKLKAQTQKWLVITGVTMIDVIVCLVLSNIGKDIDWICQLIAYLSIFLLNELINIIERKMTDWENYTLHDKLLVSLNLFVFISIAVYPLKQGMSPGYSVLGGLIGFGLIWLITYGFGSGTVKSRFLRLNWKQNE